MVGEVSRYLSERARACGLAASPATASCSTPASASGKTTEHNLELTRRFSEIVALGYPVLAGWSRKRTLGDLTGRTVASERVYASIAAALACVARVRGLCGCMMGATVDALRVWGRW